MKLCNSLETGLFIVIVNNLIILLHYVATLNSQQTYICDSSGSQYIQYEVLRKKCKYYNSHSGIED